MRGLLPFFPSILKISIWALDLEKGIAEQTPRGEVVPKTARQCPKGCHGENQEIHP
jgi:hypothetical protein